jgi:hypothetical protein
MVGLTGNSPEDILFEIHRIFEEIPKETLTAIYSVGMTRLELITGYKGEAYHIDSIKPTSS